MFSKDELKSLASFVQNTYKDNKMDGPEEEVEACRKFWRQLEVIRYEPMLFEDICNEYNLDVGILTDERDNLPLRIADKGLLSNALVRWRLSSTSA